VVSGKIKIYKLSREGKEQILHIFGAGEIFGEVPVFAGGSYPANAEAIEPGRVLFFPRDSFIALIEREPSIALNMLAILSQRLRRFTHLIEDLSLKEVPGRLAAYLIYLGERSGNPKPWNSKSPRPNWRASLGPSGDPFANPDQNGSAGDNSRRGKKIGILDRKALESLAAGGRGCEGGLYEVAFKIPPAPL